VTLKENSATSITLSWAKVAGASSYTVYRSTSSGTGFTKLKTTSKTKLTNKGLNSNTTYYYYVVANGVSVSKKTYKSTTATYREIAYGTYNKKENRGI
jgi:fibronectin type 3 domain-containing protein